MRWRERNNSRGEWKTSLPLLFLLHLEPTFHPTPWAPNRPPSAPAQSFLVQPSRFCSFDAVVLLFSPYVKFCLAAISCTRCVRLVRVHACDFCDCCVLARLVEHGRRRLELWCCLLFTADGLSCTLFRCEVRQEKRKTWCGRVLCQE